MIQAKGRLHNTGGKQVALCEQVQVCWPSLQVKRRERDERCCSTLMSYESRMLAERREREKER